MIFIRRNIRNSQNLVSKSLLGLTGFIFLFIAIDTFLISSEAEAGVLFRNRRQIIRTIAPRFRTQQYNVRLSSRVMRSVGPNLRSTSYGGVKDELKLVRSYNKYQKKLHKWERKQAKKRAKLAKKRKKLAEKRAKQLKRKRARLEKKRARELKKIEQSQTTSATTGTISKNSSSRGSLGISPSSKPQNQQKRKGFWARLTASLFGRSK